MSLEDRIKENTQALNELREVIKQALAMTPPAMIPAPATAPAPVAEPAAKESEIKNEAPAPEPKPVDLKALRISLAPKIKTLYSKDMNLGKRLLDKFGVKNLSALSDDQLPGFAQEIDRALQGD